MNSAVKSKTPVSVLYEYGVKHCCTPIFDLVSGGSGPNTVFTYVAKYKDHEALGRGRSMQEAKHDAAKNLLQLLKIPISANSSDVNQLMVPHEDSVRYNAVGALYDYCKKNCHPEAVYNKVDEVGPPHAKEFTMKCCVSQLSTLGKARTIKEAKHQSAHKMLTLLQLDAGDKPMAVALPNQIQMHEEEVQTLETSHTTNYQPQALYYNDYCNAYLNLPESSPTISELKKLDKQPEKPSILLSKIADELAVPVSIQSVNEKGVATELSKTDLENCKEDYDPDLLFQPVNCKEEGRIIIITLQLNPPITCMGETIQKASSHLLSYLQILCT